MSHLKGIAFESDEVHLQKLREYVCMPLPATPRGKVAPIEARHTRNFRAGSGAGMLPLLTLLLSKPFENLADQFKQLGGILFYRCAAAQLLQFFVFHMTAFFLLLCRPHDVCTLAPLRSYGENL